MFCSGYAHPRQRAITSVRRNSQAPDKNQLRATHSRSYRGATQIVSSPIGESWAFPARSTTLR
jgi:hypothetical protein